jgi:hypothetical protein
MPGGMGGFGGSTQGAANDSPRKGPKTKGPKRTKKKGKPAHNRGIGLYGMSGGKGSSMQSKRRGKKPFSPAKARNIG